MNAIFFGLNQMPSGAAPPAFGAEIQRGSETDSTLFTEITLASGVAQNERVFVIVSRQSGGLGVLTDAGLNVYAKDKESLGLSGNINVGIFSANATTALSTGNKITITWGDTDYTYRAWVVLRGTGIATSSAVDQTAIAAPGSPGTSISIPADTTAANTFVIGVIQQEATAATYGSSSWTISGAAHDWAGGIRNYYVYKNLSSNGTQNPNGTLSASAGWHGIWAAYKA